jgi:hypothetical protein
MVRNTRPGPTVFTHGSEHIEWDGAGDAAGGDVQPVPRSFLDSVQFRRVSTRGILVIEDSPDVIDTTFAAHKAAWDQRLDAQRHAGEESIDEAPNNDSVVRTCLGPSGRGPNQACGADVPIKAAKLAEVPPLCTFHEHMAAQFVSSEGERIVEGKPEIVWTRVQIDGRE